MVKFFPMLVDGINNQRFIRRRQLRPIHLNFLLAVFLTPNLRHSMTLVGTLVASPNNMNMPPILIGICRKNGKDKTQNECQFAHLVSIFATQKYK